ncbi:MAG: sigma-70 family RNA polymerase sigma factor [Defluviitaleaceae bacterium]|nr:sigma-70 family RNA polymerase sigma factor [Defluviitaleaceae bacterium]
MDIDANLLAMAKREIQKGQDSKAFEKLLLKYEKLIYYISRKYFTSHDDALDASQEAAVKIYNAITKLNMPETGSLKAWVCTVTARTCLDILRKKRPETTELIPETITETTPSAETIALANEQAQKLATAIQNLSIDYKTIIILRDMQGLSYEEIATALNINSGTVKSRLSRARLRLRDMIRD